MQQVMLLLATELGYDWQDILRHLGRGTFVCAMSNVYFLSSAGLCKFAGHHAVLYLQIVTYVWAGNIPRMHMFAIYVITHLSKKFSQYIRFRGQDESMCRHDSKSLNRMLTTATEQFSCFLFRMLLANVGWIVASCDRAHQVLLFSCVEIVCGSVQHGLE